MISYNEEKLFEVIDTLKKQNIPLDEEYLLSMPEYIMDLPYDRWVGKMKQYIQDDNKRIIQIECYEQGKYGTKLKWRNEMTEEEYKKHCEWAASVREKCSGLFSEKK